MAQHAWSDAPPDVRAQVERLIVLLRAHVGDDLIGVYLHGSLATGSFSPARSDIDLLAVTERRMPISAKWRVAQVLLRLSGAPSPIEISFLHAGEIRPWSHPAPFDLHYSETHRRRYENDLRSDGWKNWNREVHVDEDLAAHVTFTKARGICLWGKPIDEAFPDVPEGDYVASLLADLEWARAREDVPTDYRLLNLCRVFAYLRDGGILSKDEGGEWALGALPEKLRGAIGDALGVYRGDVSGTAIEYEGMEGASTYMERKIDDLAGARTSPSTKEE